MSPTPPPELFARIDEADDGEFYAFPRLVTHVDDVTIAALTAYLDEVFPADSDRSLAVLDLMSSWVSHLPLRAYREVVCLGMNADELAANRQATGWLVHDLNRTPSLPFARARFDWVLVSFSVQYLIDPVAVLRDAARVLVPGGTLLIAMSHRCFPTKAVRAFHALPPVERIRLVAHCIELSGSYEIPVFIDRSPQDADPLWLVSAARSPTAPAG
jgi:SAM-dependent methyltransferase